MSYFRGNISGCVDVIIGRKANFINEHKLGVETEHQFTLFTFQHAIIATGSYPVVALQRQGRIGTYVPFAGQEAAQVGSALALGNEDWMFPTYRDHGASLTFGADLDRMLLHWNGRIEGCLPSREKKIMPASIPIATHLPHATGAAMAEGYKGTRNAAIACNCVNCTAFNGGTFTWKTSACMVSQCRWLRALFLCLLSWRSCVNLAPSLL